MEYLLVFIRKRVSFFTIIVISKIHRHLIKLDRLMVLTTCLVVNVSSVSNCIKILAVKVGISVNQIHLPYQPICLISPPALSAHLPYQPTFLISPPALLAHLPYQPTCFISLPVLFWCSSLCQLLALSLVTVIFCELIVLINLLLLNIFEKGWLAD